MTRFPAGDSEGRPPFTLAVPAIVVLLAFAGAFLVWYSINDRPGLSPDSSFYLDAAARFAAGKGLSISIPPDREPALTHFPPLYSIWIAEISTFCRHRETAISFGNAFLFSVTILLVGWLTYRISSCRSAPVIAALLTLLSPALSETYLWVWSETLFIPVVLIALGAQSLERTKRVSKSALVATAVAPMVRYAGLSLVVINLSPFNRAPSQSFRRRALATVLALVPFAGWMLRNRVRTHDLIDRAAGVQVLPLRTIAIAARTLLGWLAPPNLPLLLKVCTLIAVVSVVLLAVSLHAPSLRERLLAANSATRTIIVFLASYVGLVLISSMTVEPQIALDGRIMAPIAAVCIPLVAAALASGFRCASGNRRRILLCGLWIIGVIYAAAAAMRASHVRTQHLGFATDSWRSSEAMHAAARLSDSVALYSNGADVLLMLTGRSSYRLPHRTDFRSEGGMSASDMWELRKQAETGPLVVAVFDSLRWRRYFADEAYLQQFLTLEVMARFSDGTFYRASVRK